MIARASTTGLALGESEDGSYVYFAANGVLAPGAQHGDCEPGHAEADCNLYVWHDGSTKLVAVVDDGGWPILIERMDHAAYLASVELAPGKARTAALFKKPSQALEDAINHGRVAAVTAQGFTEMQGGLPVVVDGEVIGAIGASFDTPEHDVQIAQAGLAAVAH